jgi:hypothetical protein
VREPDRAGLLTTGTFPPPLGFGLNFCGVGRSSRFYKCCQQYFLD